MFFDGREREHRLAWTLYCDAPTINQYDPRRAATPFAIMCDSLCTFAYAAAAAAEARNLMNIKKKKRRRRSWKKKREKKGLCTKNLSSKHCGYGIRSIEAFPGGCELYKPDVQYLTKNKLDSLLAFHYSNLVSETDFLGFIPPLIMHRVLFH